MKIATTVLRKDNKVLLIKKPTNRYSMPGGKSEHLELPIKTAVREFYEETGLHIYSPSLKVISMIDKCGKKFDMYTFYCEKFDGFLEKDSLEGTLEWINIDELKDLEMYPSDLDIIEHCLNSYELVNLEFSY